MGVTQKLFIFGTILTAFVGYKLHNIIKPPHPPTLEETWWGGGDPQKQNTSIRPFTINISDEVLLDLKYRLDHAREFTPPLEGVQQQYGMNTRLLQEIVDFWKTKYDWKQREKLLNKYPQFLTNIQGLDIHYIHVKPQTTTHKVLPLLLLHGWPGTTKEFLEAIPLLTTPQKDRKFVFEVIVADLPGYGFSQAAVRPGFGAPQMAVVFKNLMKRLGFERFYGQGGDFGSLILHHISVLYPQYIMGFHSNMCVVYTPLALLKTLIGTFYPTLFVKPEHVDRVYPLSKLLGFMIEESGYFHLQATKPDTIGVALKDSPVGLAAYMLEKIMVGTNRDFRSREDGGLKHVWDYADLLDNVMVYWVTGSMPTAVRIYAESFSINNFFEMGVMRMPVQVPTACARFKHDFYTPDGMIHELYPNLLHLSDYDGGHFAPFEMPEVLTNDVYVAVEKFESFYANTKYTSP